MIDLSDICGFTLKFDETRGKFIYSDEIHCECEEFVSLSEIIPVLLNKQLKYPEKVYRQLKNISTKENLTDNHVTFDILHIPYGLLGIEFIKTHIYNSPEVTGKYDCVIQLLMGELMVVMQKNGEREDQFQMDTFVDDLIVVSLNPGDKLAVPSGYMYTFVNIGLNQVVLSKISSTTNNPMDYSELRREKGLAYFVISKNAKVETVANPKYKIRCEPTNITAKKLFKDEKLRSIYMPFEPNEPLFNIFRDSNIIEDLIFVRT
jgi:oxalate decarboxylase/phosphoglucose isomerase-like protein (cupin superfamily)